MNLNEAIGIAGLVLGTASFAISYSDWRHRTAALAPNDPASAPTPPPPPTRAVVPTREVVQTRPQTQIQTQTPARPYAHTQPSRVVASSVPLSIPRRILSGLIDIYSGIFVASIIAALLAGDASSQSDEYNAALLFAFAAVAGAFAFWHAKNGRSLGKHITGGRLQRYSNPALPVSLLRWVSRLALTLIPFGWWMVFGTQRRTAYDRLTDTEVVRFRNK